MKITAPSNVIIIYYLRSAMSAAVEYLGTVHLEEGNEIRKMVITLKDHYLPET